MEGENHSLIAEREGSHWFDNFDGLVTNWMRDLVNAGPFAGIIDERLRYSKLSDTFCCTEPTALNYE